MEEGTLKKGKRTLLKVVMLVVFIGIGILLYFTSYEMARKRTYERLVKEHEVNQEMILNQED